MNMSFNRSKAKSDPPEEPTKAEVESANELVNDLCSDPTLKKYIAPVSSRLMKNEALTKSVLNELNKVNGFARVTTYLEEARKPPISSSSGMAAAKAAKERGEGELAGGRRRTKNAKYYNKRRRSKRRRSKRRRSNKRRA